MRIIIGIVIYFIVSVNAFAQEVRFEKAKSWQQIVTKAKTSRKYIFIDCFATWCGPCKIMDRSVFNQKEVIEFMNENFINVKVQFDSTKSDNEEIKDMRAVAKLLTSKYNVNAFPTFLFFDSLGNLVAKETGAILPFANFLKKVASAKNPKEQYYTLRKSYEQGDSSKALILKLLPEAVRLEDWITAYAIHDRYVDFIDTPYTKESLFAIYASLSSKNSRGFRIFLNQPDRADSILGDRGRSEVIVKRWITEDIYKTLLKDNAKRKVWPKIYKYLQKTPSKYTNQIYLDLRVNDARVNNHWELYGKLKMDYYDKYAAQFDHNAKFIMNNELMEIFEKCCLKNTLERAAKWSKVTIYRDGAKESPPCIDTYANLLYKSGNVAEAILWQEKAIALIRNETTNPVPDAYIENLNKMKSGTPTWSLGVACSKNQ